MDTGDILRLNERRTRGQQRLYQQTATVSTRTPSFPEPPKTGIASQLKLQTPRTSRSSGSAKDYSSRLPEAKETTVFLIVFNHLLILTVFTWKRGGCLFPLRWSTVHSVKNSNHQPEEEEEEEKKCAAHAQVLIRVFALH